MHKTGNKCLIWYTFFNSLYLNLMIILLSKTKIYAFFLFQCFSRAHYVSCPSWKNSGRFRVHLADCRESVCLMIWICVVRYRQTHQCKCDGMGGAVWSIWWNKRNSIPWWWIAWLHSRIQFHQNAPCLIRSSYFHWQVKDSLIHCYPENCLDLSW